MRHALAVEPPFPQTLTLSLPPSRRAKAPLRREGGNHGKVRIVVMRRGATLERHGPFERSAVAPRRRIVWLAGVRGLKPTATIVVSLRETD